MTLRSWNTSLMHEWRVGVYDARRPGWVRLAIVELLKWPVATTEWVILVERRHDSAIDLSVVLLDIS